MTLSQHTARCEEKRVRTCSYELFLLLSSDPLHVTLEQASTPCDVTAVSHNAQHSNADVTAPSRCSTHPVTTNSWGIQPGGRGQAESCQTGRVSPTLEIWTALISRVSENVRKLHT